MTVPLQLWHRHREGMLHCRLVQQQQQQHMTELPAPPGRISP